MDAAAVSIRELIAEVSRFLLAQHCLEGFT
jgi:hypothetical protein